MLAESFRRFLVVVLLLLLAVVGGQVVARQLPALSSADQAVLDREIKRSQPDYVVCRIEGLTPEQSSRNPSKNRRPAFLALGESRPGAEQPVWFCESKPFMDNQGQGIGPLKRIDIGVYPSLTRRGGEVVLWHPDRKFFLLGKRITSEFLSDLEVP